MASLTQLSRSALKAANSVRAKAHLSPASAFCVFDLVDTFYRDEIELRFKSAPSLEGLYMAGDPELGLPAIIILSSLRPSGRQRMTCAHELGHHVFGHATALDEVALTGTGTFRPDEYLVDAFAGFLLMPKLGLLKAFTDRKVKVAAASAIDIFAVASRFGVGYGTLIRHLSTTLQVISTGAADTLRKTTPKALRKALVGRNVDGELLLVDQHWAGRAIDLALGDHVIVPTDTQIDAKALDRVGACTAGDIYEARCVGRSAVHNPSLRLEAFVRISRRGFEGRSIFRHLEDTDG